MSDHGFRVLARMRLLSAEEGGRELPLQGPLEYRPNHNFLGTDNRDLGMGSIELSANMILQPGDSVDVTMTLYPWPPDIDVSPGLQWRIQEGPRLVAIGTVLKVLADITEDSN